MSNDREQILRRSDEISDDLHKSVLAAFYSVMQKSGVIISSANGREAALIEHKAFWLAAVNLIANMVNAPAMTMAGGPGENAKENTAVLLRAITADCEKMYRDFAKGELEGLSTIHMRGGEVVQPDFRDHLKRDSGRASGIGG